MLQPRSPLSTGPRECCPGHGCPSPLSIHCSRCALPPGKAAALQRAALQRGVCHCAPAQASCLAVAPGGYRWSLLQGSLGSDPQALAAGLWGAAGPSSHRVRAQVSSCPVSKWRTGACGGLLSCPPQHESKAGT